MNGTVARLMFEKSFGFITGHDGQSYFFHSSGVRDIAFAELREGERVEFDREASPKGPRATNVRPVA